MKFKLVESKPQSVVPVGEIFEITLASIGFSAIFIPSTTDGVYKTSRVEGVGIKDGKFYVFTRNTKYSFEPVDENKRLCEALEYYADTKHYEPYCIPIGDYASDITEDNGEIARKALEGGEQE